MKNTKKKGGKSYNYNLNRKVLLNDHGYSKLKKFGDINDNDYNGNIICPVEEITHLMNDSISIRSGIEKKKKKLRGGQFIVNNNHYDDSKYLNHKNIKSISDPLTSMTHTSGDYTNQPSLIAGNLLKNNDIFAGRYASIYAEGGKYKSKKNFKNNKKITKKVSNYYL